MTACPSCGAPSKTPGYCDSECERRGERYDEARVSGARLRALEAAKAEHAVTADREAVDLDALVARAEALLAVADKATPGPWYGHDEEPRAVVSAANPDLSLLGIDVDGTAVVYRIEDARAIAALRDAPALIRDLLAALGDNLTTKETP